MSLLVSLAYLPCPLRGAAVDLGSMTAMVRIEKGFDFLGYHFSPFGLSSAQKTIDNFVEKSLRFYGQEPPLRRMERLGEYSHQQDWWVIVVTSLAIMPPTRGDACGLI